MRCLYEVLQIEQEADESAIRSAYRKGALQWHPDKNQHRLEEADTRFKEIQNAYEILSDKHERAWYDDHRDAILRSGDRHQAGAEGFSAGQKPDDFVDLYAFFSKSCFTGYNDGPQGFYTVYAGIFAKVAEQEVAAAEANGGKAVSIDAPAFGSSKSEWKQVEAFYSYWMAFVSCQEFSWADRYNPATAAVRKVRRMMEDENKKHRKAMRKEFNETVRELVAFVRKRDKRVIAHQAEEARIRADKETEALKRREEERLARLEAAKAYVEADWIRESEAAADDYTSEDEVTHLEQFECVACDKIFKSEKALTNHTRSKKHKEKLAALREALQEDAALGTESSWSDLAAEPEVEPAAAGSKHQLKQEIKTARASSAETSSSQPAQSFSASRHWESAADSEASEEDLSEDAMLARLIEAQQGAAGSSLQHDDEEEDDGWETVHHADSLTNEDAAVAQDLQHTHLDEPLHPGSIGRIAGNAARSLGDQESGLDGGTGLASEDPEQKPRRRKMKHRHSQTPQPVKVAASVSQDAASCAVCGHAFASRNQMFKHIASTGHAARR
ncbi:hypothetical protein WJX74_001541 [Apatococcus lobatus]|uniref:Uncharacterized protein n=1 Tax=Apatococcus lobatus TaxID=904363 RepID=A0AAW1QKW7_9CHLO